MTSLTGDYAKVKTGKLMLKGGKKRKSTKHSSNEATGEDVSVKKSKKPDLEEINPRVQDEKEHGGWWKYDFEGEVKAGSIAIEMTPMCYLSALDNGKFTIGAPHPGGEGPAPEEIFTLLKPPDCSWVAIKTGYGRYIGLEGQSTCLTARSEAVGQKERWDIVFEDGDSGSTALQSAASGLFLTSDLDKEAFVHASSSKAKDGEIVKLRSDREKDKAVDFTPEEDKLKSVKGSELAYVKKFQSFQDRKLRLNPGDKSDLERAKTEGDFHEVMLDRREKMKSDKFCK